MVAVLLPEAEVAFNVSWEELAGVPGFDVTAAPVPPQLLSQQRSNMAGTARIVRALNPLSPFKLA